MAEPGYRVKSISRIRNNTLVLSGEKPVHIEAEGFSQFAEEAYRHSGITYPKFHKMDNLSKLGFLGAEILLKNAGWAGKYAPDRIGIILANKSSSLDTDIRYQNMLKNGVASPAVFVYSLPNIVIGEISIRNGIKGENTFFASDLYDIRQQVEYVNLLLDSEVIDACICGWVEFIGESYDSFIYLVGKNEDESLNLHTVENIEDYYNKQ